MWDEELCIQCGKCVMVCPHAVIRSKLADPERLSAAPGGFKSTVARWKDREHLRYMLQVSPEDCTACTLCVEVCPAKSKSEPSRRRSTWRRKRPFASRSSAIGTSS